jgi:hypothetical protein
MVGLSEESSWRALLIGVTSSQGTVDECGWRPRSGSAPCAMYTHARDTSYLEHSQSRVSQRRGPTQAGTGFSERGIVMSNEREEVDLGDAALPLSIAFFFQKAGGVSRES